MGKNSGIEWTDHTFNPWWGCARISPACDFCYAATLAHRVAPAVDLWQPNGPRRQFGDKHWEMPLHWNREAIASGTNPRVFCLSMGDIFDTNSPPFARERLWNLVQRTPALRWMFLTKRIGNAGKMLPSFWRSLGNVSLGITVVNQTEVERDVPKLLVLPAPMRFLSIEPMLGPVDLRWYFTAGPSGPVLLDWVIVGGESGTKARAMSSGWATAVRDQCAARGVPFFFKQWGEWAPPDQFPDGMAQIGVRGVPQDRVGGELILRAGKKQTGRRLSGVEHSDYPTWRTVEHAKEITF